MSVFGDLQNLRDRPIGDQGPARAARKGFRQRIAIARDNHLFGEEVVEAREMGLAGENFYASARNPPYWHKVEGATDRLWLRRSVAEKLARVNARAGEAGLELFLFDAWRPRAVQAYFHDIWMPRELKRRDPSLSGAALTEEVERYWAAPSDNAGSPAPHATAAAVDLTLRWKGGEQLWMGSLFDDVTALAHRDRFENLGSRELFLFRSGSPGQSPPAALADGGRRLCRPSRRMVALLLGRPDVGGADRCARRALWDGGYSVRSGARHAREQVLRTCENDERRELGRAAGTKPHSNTGLNAPSQSGPGGFFS